MKVKIVQKEDAMVIENKEQQIKENNETRLRRAKLWMWRAEASSKLEFTVQRLLDDNSVRFIFWWIAFEALYSTKLNSSNDRIKKFIKEVVKIDEEHFSKITRMHKRKIRALVSIAATHEEFWQKGDNRTYEEWRIKFNQDKITCEKGALSEELGIVFVRLHTVRNQIFHGANSRHRSYGRRQVEHGVKLLEVFIPRFIKIVEESADKMPPKDWKSIPFPRKSRDNIEKLIPAWKE